MRAVESLEATCALAARLVVVAPHPDDEAVGAAVLMRRATQSGRAVTVVFVTTGVPAPARLHADYRARYGSHELYAAVRAREAAAAMRLYDRVEFHNLGYSSREVIDHVDKVAVELLRIVRAMPESVLIGPAFEGGHPDHDLLACICDVVAARTRSPSLEYMGYHWARDRVRYQEFREGGPAPWVLLLTENEVQFKASVLACYASQRAGILHKFRPDSEAFRLRPRYAYERGELGDRVFYEEWGAEVGASDVVAACKDYYRRASLPGWP